jgi:hypothetical protein
MEWFILVGCGIFIFIVILWHSHSTYGEDD